MKYPDSFLPAGNELEVDFTSEIRKRAEAKKLSSQDVNNLPDSDFAYISPGGTKDSEGKTTPRSLRHLPIPDAAHVRNALARLNQTKIPAAAKKSALAKIKKKAKELGVQVSESDGASDKQKAAKEKFLEMINKKKGGDKKDSDKKDSDKKDSDKKSDDKKSSEKDKSKGGMKDGKPSYPDLDKPNAAKTKQEWDKVDKKELKRDTTKEKKEHEKDAVKDDESKIKKLKKGAPSEKKSVEIHDIKKDEKFDKKNKKADATHWPKVAFKPAPFDGVLESAPYSKLLEPVDWDKLKKELGFNNLWFKKPKAPKEDYRKFLDPDYTP